MRHVATDEKQCPYYDAYSGCSCYSANNYYGGCLNPRARWPCDSWGCPTARVLSDAWFDAQLTIHNRSDIRYSSDGTIWQRHSLPLDSADLPASTTYFKEYFWGNNDTEPLWLRLSAIEEPLCMLNGELLPLEVSAIASRLAVPFKPCVSRWDAV